MLPVVAQVDTAWINMLPAISQVVTLSITMLRYFIMYVRNYIWKIKMPQNTTTILLVPVQVNTVWITLLPVIAQVDSIWIEHWYYLEDEKVS